MSVDQFFAALLSDVRYGYLDRSTVSPRHANPQIVLNTDAGSMLRTLREELKSCSGFSFSVAFVSPRAIALLKQEFVDFRGTGRIVTSDYLGFNRPEAFAELGNLAKLGIDARLHMNSAYHPKGYIFDHPDHVTAILGSSNLTESALVRNHEWNLKVSAAKGSDLADQLSLLVEGQVAESAPITDEWLDMYALAYKERRAGPSAPWKPTPRIDFALPLPGSIDGFGIAHPQRGARPRGAAAPTARDAPPSVESDRSQVLGDEVRIIPNGMQQEALGALESMRAQGKSRAIVISATGTGKTIMSALDVRAVRPNRLLFIVHREQVLDRAIAEYQRVLDAPATDFGKLTGNSKQSDRKYVFATIQTLSREDVLSMLAPDEFDYILIDEVHRAGAQSYLRVVDHFTPNFLLGMTATPERTDGFNVFELFDFNVAYEIRLNRALEEGMLSPFHYYGIADLEFEDGTTATPDTDLSDLVSRMRVDHIVAALETYGQAGVQPRGLIFCSRKTEAHELALGLNRSSFRGKPLRTVALTGEDSIERREDVVRQLEAGELDYVLTVDVFNEGVDIPSVNQVVMLRQTQSSIVFVQQLGRGLRKHDGKEYLVVIDFIGNYANNYLIPIALFGDDSLNKESLRKNLLAAEETGVLSGLSSVRFDQISQARVLKSIVETKLDSMRHLKESIEILENRLGRLPELRDFLRFESVDPVLLATKVGSYPALLEKLFKRGSGLSQLEQAMLSLLSIEALAAKRPHELLALQSLLQAREMTVGGIQEVFERVGAASSPAHVDGALRSFTLEFYTEAERNRYTSSVVERDGDRVRLASEFAESYDISEPFARAVDDLIDTGLLLSAQRYDARAPFTLGRQYSRKDACRLLLWKKNVSSTIYGYRVDSPTKTCPVFVTYHKADHIAASTAYEDELIDRNTMRWFTRSRRTFASKEVSAIVRNEVAVHVFAKKDDAEGADFYYLGQASSSSAEETTMPGDDGQPLSVVRMKLHFQSSIDSSVYDYFHPVVMA